MLKVTGVHEDSEEGRCEVHYMDLPFPTTTYEVNTVERECELMMGWTSADLEDGTMWDCRSSVSWTVVDDLYGGGRMLLARLYGRGDSSWIVIEEIKE